MPYLSGILAIHMSASSLINYFRYVHIPSLSLKGLFYCRLYKLDIFFLIERRKCKLFLFKIESSISLKVFLQSLLSTLDFSPCLLTVYSWNSQIYLFLPIIPYITPPFMNSSYGNLREVIPRSRY